MFSTVKKFLARELQRGSSLLLGYSGGADSTALFYALQECARFFPFKLHVAHVDHGWREESAGEALALQRQVEGLGYPFYLKRLSLPNGGGNLEDRARGERYRFFKGLYEELGCQALLLGHHADDLAETVLKRLLEGASLVRLTGMQEVSELWGMQVWRPFLTTSKEELLAYVRKKSLPFIEDLSNKDEQFLRARMRGSLLPEIERRFGKRISKPLKQLSLSALELKFYLQRRIAPYLERAQWTEEGGVVLDLSPFVPMESVELKALLREVAKKLGTTLSFEALENLCKLLNSNCLRKSIGNRTHTFHVDRGVLIGIPGIVNNTRSCYDEP